MKWLPLHIHSEYSVLEGTLSIEDIVKYSKVNGYFSIALTDLGNMFAAMEFYTTAQKQDLNPILGVELFVTPSLLKNPPLRESHGSIILLAKNNIGYRNLSKICSKSFTEHKYPYSCILRSSLASYSEGLICLLPNYKSELGKQLDTKSSYWSECLEFYRQSFKDLYLCVSDHGHNEEKRCNELFLDLHQKYQIPLVATWECYYHKPENHQLYEVVRCIDEGIQIGRKEQLKINLPTNQFYFPTEQEVIEKLGAFPNAIENTLKIAEQCKVQIKLGEEFFWPQSSFPDEFKNDDDYLEYLTFKGLKDRFGEYSKEIEERAKLELNVMKQMKVAGYMLVVQDLIYAARQRSIPVGPGRGSAVGSLVCYALKITDVDPMKFNLLFERFLNLDRISMPDIDIDFSDKERSKVIDYAIEKYGKECVSQLITYGTLKAKQVLKDVGRALGYNYEFTNNLVKLFPEDNPFATLDQAIKSSRELKEFAKQNQDQQDYIHLCRILEGNIRQIGMHAAAIIIAPKPIEEIAPICRQNPDSPYMVQYDKKFSEEIGLLKMDLLGLRNLSVIKDTIGEVKKKLGIEIDFSKIDDRDPKTFQLISEAKTTAIFQFESLGMKEYLMQLKPDKIEDLIAMNALYRPGPMSQIPNFIARKSGKVSFDYYHPNLEKVLKETHGVIIYQEQVMQIVQIMSSFSLGEADGVRRVMSKKDTKKMNTLKPKFLEGALKNNYTSKLANQIWEELIPFSSYAFNKSHSAAYAAIAFQTAFLKANYSAQFMAMNMASESNNTERLVSLLKDCYALNLKVQKPDINLSSVNFSSTKNDIVYGLAGIKNVGKGMAQRIVASREKEGSFKSLLDLCLRLDKKDLNRKLFEALVFSGALDCFHGTRSQIFTSIEEVISRANLEHRDRESGQFSLFAIESENISEVIDLPDIRPWSNLETLMKEKSVLGIYLSGHPLDDYRIEIQSFSTHTISENSLRVVGEKDSVVIGGILNSVKRRLNKQNKTFAFAMLEGFEQQIDINFWADVYEEYQHFIHNEEMVLLRCSVNTRSQRLSLNVRKVMNLKETARELTRSICLKVPYESINSNMIEKIDKILESNLGQCQVYFEIKKDQKISKMKISKEIKLSPQILKKLEKVVGRANVKLQTQKI